MNIVGDDPALTRSTTDFKQTFTINPNRAQESSQVETTQSNVQQTKQNNFTSYKILEESNYSGLNPSNSFARQLMTNLQQRGENCDENLSSSSSNEGDFVENEGSVNQIQSSKQVTS